MVINKTNKLDNLSLRKIKKTNGLDNLSLRKTESKDKPFSSLNFWLMGGCLVLIVLGFLLMSGGGSSDPNGFNPEIFSTRRIVVGPLLSFLGFLLMAFAIICPPYKYKWKIKKVATEKEETKQ